MALISRSAIEDAIIQFLSPIQAPHKYKVMPWPDGNVIWAQMDRSLLVALSEEKWEPPLTFDGDQEGLLFVDLQLVSRNRRGDSGQLAVRDAIERRMQGKIPKVGSFYLASCGFLGRDHSIWRFGMKYQLKVYRSEIGET